MTTAAPVVAASAMRRRFVGAFVFAGLCFSADPGTAQDGIGFHFGLGWQQIGGDWGNALDGALDSDLALMYGIRGFRAGVGVNWTSMRVAGLDRSWQHTTAQLLLGYAYPMASGWRPFAEMSYLRRMARPEDSRLFQDEPPDEHIGPFRATGNGVGARLGAEVELTESTSLSLSVDRTWFETSPDPVDDGIGPTRSGSTWRFGAGMTWFPVAGQDRTSGGEDADRDLGLAIGVGSLGLLLPWTYNEYVKNKPFTAISPRSWYRGVTRGYEWDDNGLHVNYFRHPYHGQFYFNAARASGFGFATSAAFTVAGSYLWECCVETHVASFPDMVTTVVGGTALGESLYRVSDGVLDDRARGFERVVREVVGATVNPARGITRLVTGRAWANTGTESAPSSSGLEGLAPLRVHTGMRAFGEAGGSGTRALPYVALEWNAGDLLGPGRGLFSYQRTRLGLYPGDLSAFGTLSVRGSLWRSEARSDGRQAASRFSAYVDTDYQEAEAFRFATQALTLGWARGLFESRGVRARLEAEATWVLLGSVDSEYARLAEIEGVRERFRQYDFGTGGGGRLALSLTNDGRRLFEASYRLVALATLNGSNVNGTTASHTLHVVRATARPELGGGWGLGIDLDAFVQDSRYGYAEFEDASTTRIEGRVYLSWRPPTR